MLWTPFSLALACTQGAGPGAAPGPQPLLSAGEGQTLPASVAVAAADLDGDGVDEVLRYQDGVLEWEGGRAELGGVYQGSARGDIDGDGLEEALIATGMGRGDRDSPARVWRVDADGATLLIERAGARAQVPDLRVVDGRVWTVLFAADGQAESGWVIDGALDVQHRGKLALQQLPVGQGVVVGRVYGDLPKSDGDLVLHAESQTKLPSFRGVRSLASADLDGDGAQELLVGDGWHFAYGTQAIGRVQVLVGPDWKQSRLLTHLQGDYSARKIEVMDGLVLVTGTSQVHLLQRDGLGWQDVVLGSTSESGFACFVRQEQGLAVAISGSPTQIISLVQP